MKRWSAACVVCAARDRKTTLEAGHVCAVCLTRIGDDLTAILELAANASVLPVTGHGMGRTVPSSRPPINVDGVDPALTLRPIASMPIEEWPTVLWTLEEWERLVREARCMAPYGVASASRTHEPMSDTGATLTGCVGFLRASLPWWADSPEQPVEDFASEVQACRRALSRWDLDREPMGYVAYCPTDDCGARLRYRSPSEQITCPRCKVTRDVPQLVAVVLATCDADIWADPETAARHYGISVRRLRAWAVAGKVQRKAGRYRIDRIESGIDWLARTVTSST